MTYPTHVASDDIRSRFSRAMSEMYRQEVPQYGTLLDLVADINAACLAESPQQRAALQASGDLERLHVERHGAVRLGTAAELSQARRIFAVMGMQPVGYYDLSVAGVPVHSTAFRPVGDDALAANPFRLFTSLLRLELLSDPVLREQARTILARRRIFSERALALTTAAEAAGGLDEAQADEFVAEVRETFRWHGQATVSAETYRQLHDAHRLIADVVCFSGPHINHLTPRTLDIDAAQREMPLRGIAAKEVVEGPPPRRHPILLRQTSFKALVETVRFPDVDAVGSHTARFGEIEQRGVALTRTGRALYDRLLADVRDPQNGSGSYSERLAQAFAQFPDDLDTLRRDKLAFFRYRLVAAKAPAGMAAADLDALVASGAVVADPIVYEDFLPVSAAGIFQSNLGGTEQRSYAADAAQAAFERDLGAPVLDEIALYEAAQQRSIDAVFAALAPSAAA
ncbi:2-oxoadipate dioxygenase/decarboxylase HglS [Variovorax ginsengisoli]|uniref:2-oxoadipate dioxygenase/decarboxylase n=1 Tax=Variovorax ginsengisoli TaxID=363844 RepID=A0ABT9SEQ7_9BURK|nr:VOC family protein [Variovorax ginsengisoli]MDP9902846.1 putative glyoxalase superfamily metalloenzyme YdcJ [Variovorax ginsengisoli]